MIFTLVNTRAYLLSHTIVLKDFQTTANTTHTLVAAFEQMKADFPWATREMIAENTNLGIEKMDGEYQYVSYHSQYDGTRKAYKEDVDCAM